MTSPTGSKSSYCTLSEVDIIFNLLSFLINTSCYTSNTTSKLATLLVTSSQSSFSSVWTSLASCKSLSLVKLDGSANALIFDEMCGEFTFS